MGYLDTITYPNGEEVSYTYYDNGKLKFVTDGENRTTTYKYDKAGQLTRQQVVKGTEILSDIACQYDDAGNLYDSYVKDGEVYYRPQKKY